MSTRHSNSYCHNKVLARPSVGNSDRGDSVGGRVWDKKRDTSEQRGFGTDRGRTALGFNTSARLLLLLLGGRRPPCESEGFLRNKQGKRSASRRPPPPLRNKQAAVAAAACRSTQLAHMSFKKEKENRCSASGADWAPRRPLNTRWLENCYVLNFSHCTEKGWA